MRLLRPRHRESQERRRRRSRRRCWTKRKELLWLLRRRKGREMRLLLRKLLRKKQLQTKNWRRMMMSLKTRRRHKSWYKSQLFRGNLKKSRMSNQRKWQSQFKVCLPNLCPHKLFRKRCKKLSQRILLKLKNAKKIKCPPLNLKSFLDYKIRKQRLR